MENSLLKIQELYDIGWQLGFSTEGAIFMIGDCNCSFDKEYDPKDGHGFSEVAVPIGDFWDLDDLMEIAYPKCKWLVKGG